MDAAAHLELIGGGDAFSVGVDASLAAPASTAGRTMDDTVRWRGYVDCMADTGPIRIANLADVQAALARPDLTQNDVADLLMDYPREDLIELIWQGVAARLALQQAV